jgi:hypothetical protein
MLRGIGGGGEGSAKGIGYYKNHKNSVLREHGILYNTAQHKKCDRVCREAG